jgi:hypothetical protein
MNRAVSIARSGRIEGFDEAAARSMWYHCVRHAMFAAHMKPALDGSGKTRFEERYGRVFNLSEVVMLPFQGLKVKRSSSLFC